MPSSLIERLEKEIKHYDRRVRESVHSGSYDQRGADLRELLEDIREVLTRPFIVAEDCELTEEMYQSLNTYGYIRGLNEC